MDCSRDLAKLESRADDDSTSKIDNNAEKEHAAAETDLMVVDGT